MTSERRVTPCLWFNFNAEQANRVMKAVPAMDKLDIAAVRRVAGPDREDAL
jgi:predicted 3-demethylubiquinone-9 3-methyltransferase (glyoxalase superfamily)